MATELFEGEYPMTEEQVRFFRENGYVKCENVLNEAELEHIRKALDDARHDRRGFFRDLAGEEKKDGEKDKILQMVNLWQHYPDVKPYSHSSKLANMAKRLTGSNSIRLYHDQALIKEPGPSAPSPWHQDQPYWPSKEPGMISCWMALDDVIVERGAMHFIPESHKWGEFPPMSFTGGEDDLMKLLSEEQREKWNPVAVELKAGSCTWHHGLTFHYTRPNTTQQTRRAIVTIYIPDGVTYASDEKMSSPFDDSITSRKGEPLRGEFFVELG